MKKLIIVGIAAFAFAPNTQEASIDKTFEQYNMGRIRQKYGTGIEASLNIWREYKRKRG